MTERAVRPFLVHTGDVAPEGWNDGRGSLGWVMLASAGRTPTEGLTVGVATVPPNGFLAQHRHAPPEIYFILEGIGTVTIDGVASEVGPGTLVFIPGDAEHGVRNPGGAPLRFLYAFAVDRFEDITYRFSESAPSPH